MMGVTEMTEQVTSENTVVQEPAAESKQKVRPTEKNKTRTKRQPPYVVIVHNDDFHTFQYVIELLMRICGHNRLRALHLAFAIHNKGQASVWTGSLEVAELKRDQIRGYGPDSYASTKVSFPLGVTIEPLPSD